MLVSACTLSLMRALSYPLPKILDPKLLSNACNCRLVVFLHADPPRSQGSGIGGFLHKVTDVANKVGANPLSQPASLMVARKPEL